MKGIQEAAIREELRQLRKAQADILRIATVLSCLAIPGCAIGLPLAEIESIIGELTAARRGENPRADKPLQGYWIAQWLVLFRAIDPTCGEDVEEADEQLIQDAACALHERGDFEGLARLYHLCEALGAPFFLELNTADEIRFHAALSRNA
jgi:hypothetical protein